MILRHGDIAATSSQNADKVDVLRLVIAGIERERETSWLLEAHAPRSIDWNGAHGTVPSYCMTWISKVHPTNELTSSAEPWGCNVIISESLLSNGTGRPHRGTVDDRVASRLSGVGLYDAFLRSY